MKKFIFGLIAVLAMVAGVAALGFDTATALGFVAENAKDLNGVSYAMSLGVVSVGHPNIYERSRLFLEAALSADPSTALGAKIPEQSRADYVNKKLQMQDSIFVFRKLIDSTESQFILTSDDFENGITNLDGGKLPKGVVLSLTGLSVRYGVAANGSNSEPDEVLYTNCIYDSLTQYADGGVDLNANEAAVQGAPVAVQVIPTKLVNGFYILRQNDEVLHGSQFATHFVNNITGVQVPAGSFKELGIPKLIVGDIPVQFEIKFAKNGALSNDEHFIEIMFGGTYLGNARQ